MTRTQSPIPPTKQRQPSPRQVVSLRYPQYAPEQFVASVYGKQIELDPMTSDEVRLLLAMCKPVEARAAILRKYRQYLRTPMRLTYGFCYKGGRDVYYLGGNSALPYDMQGKLRAYKEIKAHYDDMCEHFHIDCTTATLGAKYRPVKVQTERVARLDPKPVKLLLYPRNIFCGESA